MTNNPMRIVFSLITFLTLSPGVSHANERYSGQKLAMRNFVRKTFAEPEPKLNSRRYLMVEGETHPVSDRRESRFDLSRWKLTLPIDDDQAYKGHAQEVGAERLAKGFQDSHFRIDAEGAMVFWCPVIGATTEGTTFPRSELREMLESGNPRQNWAMSGTHVMEARCRIIQVPSNPKVVIGQIHSYSGKPLVKLQYYKGRIEALVKLSPTKGKDKKLTFAKVELNSDVAWKIKVEDGSLTVEVNGDAQTEDMVRHDRDWANQTFYFKAGVYPQDNEGDESEGARASFSDLRVSHKMRE